MPRCLILLVMLCCPLLRGQDALLIELDLATLSLADATRPALPSSPTTMRLVRRQVAPVPPAQREHVYIGQAPDAPPDGEFTEARWNFALLNNTYEFTSPTSNKSKSDFDGWRLAFEVLGAPSTFTEWGGPVWTFSPRFTHVSGRIFGESLTLDSAGATLGGGWAVPLSYFTLAEATVFGGLDYAFNYSDESSWDGMIVTAGVHFGLSYSLPPIDEESDGFFRLGLFYDHCFLNEGSMTFRPLGGAPTTYDLTGSSSAAGGMLSWRF